MRSDGRDGKACAVWFRLHPTGNGKSLEISKYYFIASNGTVEIPLPYKSGEFKVLPDETFESF